MTQRKQLQIPFDKYGLVTYPLFSDSYTWKDNFVFEDTLEYHKYHKGKSGIQFNFKSVTTGLEYPMFLSDFHDLLINGKLNSNKVTGIFGFCKKGCNYGVYAL